MWRNHWRLLLLAKTRYIQRQYVRFTRIAFVCADVRSSFSDVEKRFCLPTNPERPETELLVSKQNSKTLLLTARNKLYIV